MDIIGILTFQILFCFEINGFTYAKDYSFPGTAINDIYSEAKSIIIDTDAGADDGLAILNLLGAEKLTKKLKTLLITTVNGNTHVSNVTKNVLKILKTVNRLDIPVYRGANSSILKTPPPEYFFGEDGFGDFDFPNPPPEKLIRKRHAVTALLKAVSLQPGKLSLVCLGPLTNIALAIKLGPNFLKHLKEIFVLGGSDSGVGNIKPGVEFNFFMDPEAAYIVFKEAEKERKLINLLTWETATVRSKIDLEWRKNVLSLLKSPQMDLLNKAERLTLNGEIWSDSDGMLSAVVIDKRIVESQKKYHMNIETCGENSRGAVFVDYDSNSDSVKNVNLLEKINEEAFKCMLLTNLGNFTTNENKRLCIV